MRIGRASLLAAGLVLCASGWSDAEARGRRVLPSEIAGNITIYGCTLDPDSIQLVAEPLSIGLPDGGERAIDPRSAPRLARIEGTAEPGRFRFSIRGLHPGAIYRLGVTHPPSPCEKTFWRGLEGGLAVAGGDPLQLEGYAARTRLAVRRASTREWGGADDLPLNDPAAGMRLLGWQSTLPDVIGGELQISTESFPLAGEIDPCGEPSQGIVYREFVPPPRRPQEWEEVGPVDFYQILTPGRAPDSPDDGQTISQAAYDRLLAGAPVYARVVPHTVLGPACDAARDGVHGWVLLAWVGKTDMPFEPIPPPGILEAWTGQTYTPPFPRSPEVPGAGHPALGELAYKVVHPHKLPPAPCLGLIGGLLAQSDPLGCVLVTAGLLPPGSTIQPEAWFYFKPGSSGGGGGGLSLSGIVGGFSTLVTEGFDALGQAVDYAQGVWEDVKAAVAEVVLEVLTAVPGIEGACDIIQNSGAGTCEGFVRAGLEIGLASMGVPPTIPNWEQLKDQGVEYLAGEIAAEIEKKTGIPQELTQDKLEELAQTAIDKMSEKRGGSGPQYTWVLPYSGLDPAVWSMTVKKSIPGPAPSNLHLIVQEGELYLGSKLPLPSRFPAGDVLRIPVVLPPNLAGIKPPLCVIDVFKNVTCQPAFFLSEPLCQFNQINQDPIFTDCSGTNYPAIYYRDRWFFDKYQDSPCVDLKAQSAAWVPALGGFWPSPSPPLVDWARLMPEFDAVWNGPFYLQPGCQ